MKYEHVCLESVGYVLPRHIVPSELLEEQLSPLYERLRLPEGRLELMSGIRERRFWDRGTRPSEKSIVSCELALQQAGWDRDQVGLLVHGSVCRDYLEPATASRVHHELALPQGCMIYDVSNACLGLLNGVLQAANMIELGQVSAALVVGSEGSRQLVETTVEALNRETSLTRKSIKSAIASLTIGSGSCAMLLTHRSLSRSQNRLLGGVVQAHTAFHQLCQSDRDEAAGDGMSPLMHTDSEALMQQGVLAARETFAQFSRELGWGATDLDKSVCHQVGVAHRKLMLQAMGLEPEIDHITYPWLGNTGSVALPITLADALTKGHIQPGERVGLFGIGSGINVVMLATEFQTVDVVRGLDESRSQQHGVVEPSRSRRGLVAGHPK